MIEKKRIIIFGSFLLFLTLVLALENDSQTVNNTLGIPVESEELSTNLTPIENQLEENVTQSVNGSIQTPTGAIINLPLGLPINEAEPIYESTSISTALTLIIDKLTAIVGEIINIQAFLKDNNQTPIPDQKIDFYADEYLGSDITDIGGKAEINWDTFSRIPGFYTIIANYSGDEVISPNSVNLEIKINQKPIDKTPLKYKFKVKDENGELIGFSLYSKDELEDEPENVVYNLTIIPEDNPEIKIEFKNIRLNENEELGLSYPKIDSFEDLEFKDVYAVNPENLEFDSVRITSIAEGETLYKCKEWDFSNSQCLGTWQELMNLTIGEEYSFVLTKEDPGFAEGNKQKNISFAHLNFNAVQLSGKEIIYRNSADLSQYLKIETDQEYYHCLQNCIIRINITNTLFNLGETDFNISLDNSKRYSFKERNIKDTLDLTVNKSELLDYSLEDIPIGAEEFKFNVTLNLLGYTFVLDPTAISGCVEVEGNIINCNGTLSGNYIDTNNASIWVHDTIINGQGSPGLIRLNTTYGWINITNATLNGYGNQGSQGSDFEETCPSDGTHYGDNGGNGYEGKIELYIKNNLKIDNSVLNSYGGKGGNGGHAYQTGGSCVNTGTVIGGNGGIGGRGTIYLYGNKSSSIIIINSTSLNYYGGNGGNGGASDSNDAGWNCQGGNGVNAEKSHSIFTATEVKTKNITTFNGDKGNGGSSGGCNSCGGSCLGGGNEGSASISEHLWNVSNSISFDDVLYSGLSPAYNFHKFALTGNENRLGIFNNSDIEDKVYVFCSASEITIGNDTTLDTNLNFTYCPAYQNDNISYVDYDNFFITFGYPTSIDEDTGNDGTIDYQYAGTLDESNSPQEVDLNITAINDYLAICTPDQNNNCLVPLNFTTSSKGIIHLSDIIVDFSVSDNISPKIHNLIIIPNPANVSSNLTVKVNATDNINLTKVNATFSTQSITLTYNQISGWYEGVLIAPSSPGEYTLYVMASDWVNLTATNSTSGATESTGGLSIHSEDPDLTLTSSDIHYDQKVLYENQLLIFNATVYNKGDQPANNFIVELLIDDISDQSKTLSIANQSNSSTQFNWTTTYGNHSITIKTDASNIISEANELNNEASINISILDVTPPIIGEILHGSVEGTPSTIKVNIADNVNISVVTATISNTTLVLDYNSTSALYENTFTAPNAGIYELIITAKDINGLATTKKISLEIYSTIPDLTLFSNDIHLFPLPLTDGTLTNLSVIVHNDGGTGVNNFTLELFVDSILYQNKSLNILSDASNTAYFLWPAYYGQHLLTLRVDPLGNITESDENNNELNLSVLVKDKTTSQINEIIIVDTSYVNANLSLKVNVTDNLNVSTVNATVNNVLILLTYNSSSDLYEGFTTAPAAPGFYQINVTATDVSDLKDNRQQPITINPAEADLTLDASDIIQTPLNPAEPEVLGVNIIIRNEGGTDANNFVVRFTVNSNVQEQNLSVTKSSTNSTYFSWNSTYSNHTITINADYYNIIIESNESNNIYTKSIFVGDVIPPLAPVLSSSPNNWSTQNIHTISWNPVEDTNGINHYEYRIDAGSWNNIGLNTSFITLPQTEGVHTIYVRAVDNPGNLGHSGNVSLYIDTSNPGTPIIKELHSGDNWTQHNSPYYTWTNPGDIGSGVVSYVGELDGNLFSLGNSQSYHVNVTSGSHTFRIYAQDALQHNSTWSNPVNIYIDSDAPSMITITSPTHPNNNDWYNLSVPIFNFSATDIHSSIYGYYYVVNNNESTTPDIMNLWTMDSLINITGIGGTVSQNNQSQNAIGLTDGFWYLHSLAKDKVGNLGNTTHFVFKIDTLAPEIVNITPANNTIVGNNTPTIVINYYDSYSGVNTSSVILQLDGDVVAPFINTTTTTYTPAIPLTGGEHDLSIQIKDLAKESNFIIYNWTFKISANESEARTAIEQGAADSILIAYQTYTSQQLYVRYLNNTQKSGRFDKVIISGNQTWVFNFLTGSDAYTNIVGLHNNVLVIWENQTLTPDEISKQVETLINQTKW
ncbi:MAG TPA: CARDB domain-containing protein [Candidatus Nanoarchaeia archaeon]|nr:CARDB domain-containing protein [Candidatus Nanoarchaeia archaeon]